MVRRAFKGLVNFVRLVRHMPPDTSSKYTAGTNEIRDATRAAFTPRGRGGVASSSRKTNKMIGKAIADSHPGSAIAQQQRQQSRAHPDCAGACGWQQPRRLVVCRGFIRACPARHRRPSRRCPSLPYAGGMAASVRLARNAAAVAIRVFALKLGLG